MLDQRTMTTSHAPPLSIPRLVLIGAMLPAAIASANYALVHHLQQGTYVGPALWLQFAWYIAQVGIIGWAVGRGISQPLMRWVVFGWILLLINLLTGVQAMDSNVIWSHQPDMAPAALIAGQMGLCVVWAFFGDTRWMWRWPGMIVAACSLYFLWLSFGNNWQQQLWTELLVLQVMTLSVLCGLMALSGFRLMVLDDEGASVVAGGSQRRPLQFGIKHVLIWTTALAIVLGIARGMDLLRWRVVQELVRDGLTWKLTVATTSAIVIIVALWAALGRGHWLPRYFLVLAFTLLLGCSLSMWSQSRTAAMQAAGWPWRYSEVIRWFEVGWSWLGWLFLSGGLLAATLIVFRVLGYRLVRVSRH
jgi:hypothetical protein